MKNFYTVWVGCEEIISNGSADYAEAAKIAEAAARNPKNDGLAIKIAHIEKGNELDAKLTAACGGDDVVLYRKGNIISYYAYVGSADDVIHGETSYQYAQALEAASKYDVESLYYGKRIGIMTVVTNEAREERKETDATYREACEPWYGIVIGGDYYHITEGSYDRAEALKIAQNAAKMPRNAEKQILLMPTYNGKFDRTRNEAECIQSGSEDYYCVAFNGERDLNIGSAYLDDALVLAQAATSKYEGMQISVVKSDIAAECFDWYRGETVTE